jgi:hypothetical protein
MINLTYTILYYLNYFSIPYDKIILLNNKKNNFVKLNMFQILIYNFLTYISYFDIIKNYLNNYFIDYNVVYRFNNKYNLSNTFLIKKKEDKSELSFSNVKNIIFEFADSNQINFFNKIKEYDSDFSIENFLKLNEINPDTVNKIVIEYIPIFNLKTKELLFDEIKAENINYLLKN